MADYYSLLSRAIANLPKTSPPAARKAIYDRARKALNSQLRSLKPPLPETDIAREETALEAAVRKLEGELDPLGAAAAAAAALAQGGDVALAPPPPPVQSPPRPPAPRPPEVRQPTPAPPKPPATPPFPVAPPPEPPSPPPASAPHVAQAHVAQAHVAQAHVAQAHVAPSHVAPPPVAAAPEPQSAPSVTVRPVLPRADEKTLAPPVVETRDAGAPQTQAPPLVAPQSVHTNSAGAPPLRPATPRDPDAPRPAAPRGDESEGGGVWRWAVVAVVFGIVGAVAFSAWLLRSQRPADLAIQDTKPPVDQPSAAPPSNQKINERVGGAAAPSPDASTVPPSPQPPTPQPAESASAAPPIAPPTAPATPSPAQTGQAPTLLMDRAAMLLAAQADVSKPAVYVGHVAWSTQPPASGQGGGPGVHAEIDIPDLKMHASMLLRKNVDPSLPATHTIDLRLTFDEGAPFKGAKDVGVLQMRREEPAAVTPLLGARVVINDTYFLIGLNRGDSDQQHNLDAIATSNWFDFPMLLPDGRLGKLTFEKGSDGEQVINAALNAWK